MTESNKEFDFKKDADAAWAELQTFNDKVDEAMLSGDREAMKAAAAEREAARKTLRPRIGRAKEQGYTPEGLPRTYKKGGVVSASKRADGIAQRGRTRGQMR